MLIQFLQYIYKLNYKSKESAINAGKNFMRYRKEVPIVKGNKILPKNKKKKQGNITDLGITLRNLVQSKELEIAFIKYINAAEKDNVRTKEKIRISQAGQKKRVFILMKLFCFVLLLSKMLC